jgi:hypothetical protein
VLDLVQIVARLTWFHYIDLFPLIASCVGRHEVQEAAELLHRELGGQGKSPNLVAATAESNNNMMDFERAVIDCLTLSLIDPHQFRAIDFEVAVNYGRSGHGVAAALPTSLDLRMTEQKTEDGGKNWIDGGPALVRNVAVNSKDKFPLPDSHGPAPEENPAMPLVPLLPPKNPIGRVQNAQFADEKVAWDLVENIRSENIEQLFLRR